MAERELLMLSGLQHFAYCRRQWALIHVEQQWQENLHTAEGQVFHQRAHDEKQTEVRGDTVIVRGMRVQSERLGVSGICDVVEFRRAPEGIALAGREGRFTVYPIEYKKGAPKEHQADELQLCAFSRAGVGQRGIIRMVMGEAAFDMLIRSFAVRLRSVMLKVTPVFKGFDGLINVHGHHRSIP